MRFLLFTLYAPVAAMGEIAVGERRMGWPRPARSAVLGLVAGALGIRREDRDGQQQLEDELGFAVRTDAPGRPFVDYHTTQVPPTKAKRSFTTRREELAADDLGTILSWREWRADALFTAILWERAVAPAFPLPSIAQALEAPSFTPYFGRKAGPFGLPLSPRVVEAEGLSAALAADPLPPERRAVVDRVLAFLRNEDDLVEIAFDCDAPGAPESGRIITRRDAPTSRDSRRWHFREREEMIAVLPRPPETNQ